MSPSKPRLADPGELIRGGKLKTAEFRACMDPDLLAEHDDLLMRRAVAKAAATDSLAGGDVVELDAQLAAALQAVEAVTVVLTFRALPRPKFRALLDQYPPRKDAEGNPHPDHARDWQIGVNYDEIWEPLVRAAWVSPALDEETMRILIEERLTDAQWADLTSVAWNLNRESVSVPFSPAGSPKSRRSSPR